MNPSNLEITSLDNILVRVTDLSQAMAREELRDHLVQTFNGFGCVVIECNLDSDLRADLLALREIFGDPIIHRSSDQEGIVTITPIDSSPYMGLTHKRFVFHTDGSFTQTIPRVFALQCEIASKEGGVSQLIQAESLYSHLAQVSPSGLRAMFDDDAVTVSTVDGESTTRPIFWWEESRVGMAFRTTDQQIAVVPKPEVSDAFEQLIHFAELPANQFQFRLEAHQILIADNTRILHGRTPIPKDEYPRRKLNRLWLDGSKAQQPRLEFGFYEMAV